MADPVQLSSSHTVQLPVQDAFDRVLVAPLEQVFARRFGPIPAIRRTSQQGDWGTVGQQRTIDFTDPGSVRERLTVVERPHRFGYTLSDVVGPMKLLIAGVEGLWAFEPDGTGTRITWSWTVHPANSVGRLAMPLFGRVWQGYARRSLAQLETLITGSHRD
jgi:Polyketide cyclase / dehydrase and lipid transport